jgi:hypothetical protein
MTIDYQSGDVGAHGATIRARAASLEAGYQAIVREVLVAADFWDTPDLGLARSSSPSWAATPRRYTSKPMRTDKRCKPPLAI